MTNEWWLTEGKSRYGDNVRHRPIRELVLYVDIFFRNTSGGTKVFFFRFLPVLQFILYPSPQEKYLHPPFLKIVETFWFAFVSIPISKA